MIGRRLRRWMYVVSAVSAVVTTLGAVAAFLWVFRPEAVFELDQDVRDWYFEPHEQALEEARALHEHGESAEAARRLETELAVHAGVLKGDTLDPIVRKEAALLLQIYRGAGRIADAIRVTRRQIAFDDLDLGARANLALLLFEDAATRREGVEVLRTLGRSDPRLRVNAHLRARGRYVDWLIEEQDWRTALELGGPVLDYSTVLISGEKVDVFWAGTDRRFDRRRSVGVSPEALEDGRWRVRVELHDPEVRELRVDFPAVTQLEIADLEWVFRPANGGPAVTVAWTPGLGRLHHMRDTRGVLFTRGGDPYVVIAVPDVFAGSAGGEVEVTFRAHPFALRQLRAAAARMAASEKAGPGFTGAVSPPPTGAVAE